MKKKLAVTEKDRSYGLLFLILFLTVGGGAFMLYLVSPWLVVAVLSGVALWVLFTLLSAYLTSNDKW